jgi:hypothetical protein
MLTLSAPLFITFQEHAKILEGQEFPMVLFTLARWQQQEQQQQQAGDGSPTYTDDDEDEAADSSSSSSSSNSYYSTAGLDTEGGGSYGYDDPAAALHPAAAAAAAAAAAVAAAGYSYNPGTAPTQGLIDELLLASYSSRALKELPVGQVAVILKALAGLQRLVGITVNPMWLKRVWPAINAKIDAAASSSSGIAADLADVLEALPLLNPRPDLPPDLVEGLVGNLGLGLGRVPPGKLAAACLALQQLDHTPDAIFVRQARGALLAAAPTAALSELPPLLRAGFVLTDTAAAAGSSSSSGGHFGDTAGEFVAALLEAVLGSFQQQLAAAAAAISSSSSSKVAKEGGLSKQQQQRVDAVAAADRQGVWSTLTVAFQLLLATAAAVAAAGSSAAAAQPRMGDLRHLWQVTAVEVAAVAPTEQLLTVLNEVLDLAPEMAQVRV